MASSQVGGTWAGGRAALIVPTFVAALAMLVAACRSSSSTTTVGGGISATTAKAQPTRTTGKGAPSIITGAAPVGDPRTAIRGTSHGGKTREVVTKAIPGIDQAALIDGIPTTGNVAVFVGVDMSGRGMSWWGMSWSLDAATLPTGQ